MVTPRFFPGGDIGTLAVAGTVNDLAVSGALPRFLSCAMILEEGLPLDDLRRVVDSMARTAAEAGVQVVTGDTKVVERGGADGIFITTAGMGELRPLPDGWGTPSPGDRVLVNGPVGDHGFAVLAAREGLMFDTPLRSDCAPLNGLIDTLFERRAARPLPARRHPRRPGRRAQRAGGGPRLGRRAAGRRDPGLARGPLAERDPGNRPPLRRKRGQGGGGGGRSRRRRRPRRRCAPIRSGREAAIIGTIETGAARPGDRGHGCRRPADPRHAARRTAAPDLLMHEMGLACSVVTEIERVLSDFGPRGQGRVGHSAGG